MIVAGRRDYDWNTPVMSTCPCKQRTRKHEGLCSVHGLPTASGMMINSTKHMSAKNPPAAMDSSQGQIREAWVLSFCILLLRQIEPFTAGSVHLNENLDYGFTEACK